MLFSSITFLYIFLPVTLALYVLVMALLQRRPSYGLGLPNALILFSSLLLYTWSESWYVGVLLLSTTVDYLCGRYLGRNARPDHRTTKDRLALVLSICVNLGVLGFFKYLNFGVSIATSILESVGLASSTTTTALEIGLPLGISFYTFQSMSYTIDVYRRVVQPTRNPIGFFAYVTMFPQLVAGPIVRYRSVETSLRNRRIGVDRFATGLQRFVFGLGKKVLVADTLSVPADQIFALDAAGALSAPVAWLGLVCYTLQIYFDFSGYSDMAIGLGRMLGFQFPENFRFPYVAQSVREFWRRWHISLSTWFKDYLYIPLGGSRGRARRTYLNLAIVFILCGLWHGASWNFIVWGAFHGAFLIVERTGFGRLVQRLWRPLRHVYALAAVMFSWVLFRCETLEHAGRYLASLFGSHPEAQQTLYVRTLVQSDVVLALLIGAVLSIPVSRELTLRAARAGRKASGSRRLAIEAGWSTAIIAFFLLVLVASAVQVASTTHQPFIYFRF